jgi:glucose/arabinose dehydrogenase
MAALGAWLLGAGATLAEPLPPGFVETPLIPTSHLARFGARDIEWTPDGRLMFLAQTNGQNHRIWVYKDGSWGDMVPAWQYVGAVPRTGERGINGIAVDPDFATNRRLWVYYNYLTTPVQHRLSVFEYDEPSDTLQNEQVVLDGPEVLNDIHNGGCLAFAPDGTLFLGIGDDGRGSPTAQNPSDLHGKILHLERDGNTGARDNPYPDGTGGDPRVWAIGMRNPFRCSVRAFADGGYTLWIGDVGASRFDELDLGIAGANYGWAVVEGPTPPAQPGMTYPFYSHAWNQGAAIIAGDHVPAGAFYPHYQGDYFFADWVHGEIYHMDLDAEDHLLSIEPWYTFPTFSIVDLEFGADGALYVAAIGERDRLYRIEHVGGTNEEPIARAVGTALAGTAPLVVSLDGSSSIDPDGDTLAYTWDLGDGTPIAPGSPVLEHSYAQGVYDARLTVDDGPSHGGVGLADVSPPIRIVAGNRTPSGTITSPGANQTYSAGVALAYSGTGTDPEEGAIPCSRFTWYVEQRHAGHVHPALGPLQGSCSGSFVVPVIGATSPDVSYRIALTVADTGVPIGPLAVLTGQHSIEVFPELSSMTFASAPLADLELGLDGSPFTAPRTVQGVVGLLRGIEAPPLQRGSDGKYWWWASWSDGLARDHEVATPAVDTTFTATFECALGEVRDLVVEKSGAGLTLRWTPPAPDPCVQTSVAGYRIWSASTPRPAAPPGSFPVDPAFTSIGTSSTESFAYAAPSAGHEFFLVTAVGANTLEGPAGHYGF